MMKRLGLFIFLIGAAAHQAAAREMEGVTLPETQTVGHHTLKLNGAGFRTATFLKVKVWVGGFYAPEPLATEKAVMDSAGPLRLDLVFLRAFPSEKTHEAWNWQFEQSASYDYPDFKKEAAAFSAFFGPVKKGGVESVELEGDETRAYDDGVLRGTIKGRDFQKAFLSLWFGSKPVMPSLKKQFLGDKI